MRYCENCSRPLADGAETCERCAGSGLKPVTGTARVLYALLAVFVPPAGIIAGAVFMARDSIEQRAFGKRTLLISLVFITLFIICCCWAYMLFVNNLA